MRKFFRFEKLGIACGIFTVSAFVTLYITFYHFVDAKSVSGDTMFFVLMSPIVVIIGIAIACGILEHYDKKKAGWKRKDRGSLPRGRDDSGGVWPEGGP